MTDDERTPAKRRMLRTASEVIDVLGGTGAVAAQTGYSVQYVSDWRRAGALPPAFYVSMQQRLLELGYAAPAALWKQVNLTDPNYATGNK